MKKINLYKASSFKYTPFDDFVSGDLKFLRENDIYIVDSFKEADIIISQNYKHLKKYFFKGFLRKKFLIWTLEPRFDTHLKSPIKLFFGLFNCYVMNVYTKDVFTSNLAFHAAMINKKLKELPNDFKLNTKKIIALMSYFKGVNSEPLYVQGSNRDLISLRSKIALEGHKLGLLDICGRGWPKGISKEDSRDGDWGLRKAELMKPYSFNLCFENTAAYNYMTEKIWGSIENYCLPIYYGKHTNVYKLFPENSFIDYSIFKMPSELFEFIEKMSSEQFIERMNLCIAVYNSIKLKGEDFVKQERERMLSSLVKEIKHIVLTDMG